MLKSPRVPNSGVVTPKVVKMGLRRDSSDFGRGTFTPSDRNGGEEIWTLGCETVVNSRPIAPLLARIQKNLGVDGLVLYYLEDGGDHLFPLGWAGFKDPQYHEIPLPAREGLFAKAYEKKRPVVIDNRELEEQAIEVADDFWSQIAIPLYNGKKPLGGLLLLSRHLGHFRHFASPIAETVKSCCRLVLSSHRRAARQKYLAGGLAMLQVLIRDLSRGQVTRGLFGEVCAKIGAILDCTDVSLLLTAGAGEQLRLEASIGRLKNQVRDILNGDPRSASHHVLRTGERLRVENITNQETFDKRRILEYRGKSFIISPLSWKGKKLGVLCATNRRHRDFFDDLDLALLSMISDFLAIFIEKQGLIDELKGVNSRLNRTFKVLRQLSKTLDPRQLLRYFAGFLEKFFHPEWISISLWDNFKKRRVAGFGSGSRLGLLQKLVTVHDEPIERWLLRQPGPVFIEDAHRHLELRQGSKDPNAAIVFLPIRHKDRPLGWLFVGFDRRKDPPGKKTFNHIVSLTGLLTTYLSHANLHLETERNLADLELVHEVGKIFSSQVEMNAMTNMLLDSLLRLAGGDRGWVFLRKGDEYSVIRSKRAGEADIKVSAHTKKWRAISNAFPAPAILTMREFRQRSGLTLGPLRDGEGSILLLPLEQRSEIEGMVVLIKNRGPLFTAHDLALTHALCGYAGVAIENAARFKGLNLFTTGIHRILLGNGGGPEREGAMRREFRNMVAELNLPRNFESEFLRDLDKLLPGNPFTRGKGSK